uniref:RING-type domain-containing protein n=1 Tax=Heliothis virescens TaxID=7102 RepID=A0A2A4K1D4_HELVI
MNNTDIDQTIQNVKNILEKVQCTICDKLDGNRVRYPCGHTACEDCAVDAQDCLICLTPPLGSNTQPVLDEAFTQRVKNAALLRKTCEKLFNTDVFKHKRLSEQLRIEKELFPECIQAPVKYENKRKSTSFSHKNKENRFSIFPGEETSHHKENMTMENSVRYVQNWLNSIENDSTRRPFRDLNVNTQVDHGTIIPKSNKTQENKNISVVNRNRKRSHFKTTVKNLAPQTANLKSNINKLYKNNKRVKKEINQPNLAVGKYDKSKHDNDESGIFMDNDPILIDDSQEVEVDKDKNAWLAVLKANENEEIESTSELKLDNSDHKQIFCANKQTLLKANGIQSKSYQNIKVPFYKKSIIGETCAYCNAEVYKSSGQNKDTKIIIDDVNFTTTIKILKDDQHSSKLNTKKTVSVQTDISDIMPTDHCIELKDTMNTEHSNLNQKECTEDLISKKSDTQSVDLFEDEGQNNETGDKQNNPHSYLVISESESDIEMDTSGPLPVKVDVHRSCEESDYGILSEVVNIQRHDIQPRRGPRGLTPTSTDSSEKENFNPNRMKKQISKKKKNNKKH